MSKQKYEYTFTQKKIKCCATCKLLRYEEDATLHCPLLGDCILHQFAKHKDCPLKEVKNENNR